MCPSSARPAEAAWPRGAGSREQNTFDPVTTIWRQEFISISKTTSTKLCLSHIPIIIIRNNPKCIAERALFNRIHHMDGLFQLLKFHEYERHNHHC